MLFGKISDNKFVYSWIHVRDTLLMPLYICVNDNVQFWNFINLFSERGLQQIFGRISCFTYFNIIFLVLQFSKINRARAGERFRVDVWSKTKLCALKVYLVKFMGENNLKRFHWKLLETLEMWNMCQRNFQFLGNKRRQFKRFWYITIMAFLILSD